MSAPPAATASRLLPFGAFAACTLIWGSTFLFISIGNDRVAPLWATTLRLVLATAILLVIAFAVRAPWPRGATLRAAIAFGVADFGLSLPLLYWGEKAVPSAIAAILFATLPLLTAVIAHAFGVEPIGRRRIAAGLVGLAGVAVLVSSQLRGAVPPLPMFAVFLGAATAALAGVLLARAPHGHPIVTNALAHAAGVPFCLAASVALHESRAWPATFAAWAPILYLTVAGSVIAFVAFAWLVQRWSVGRISFIAVITPVIATALGAFVHHERLGFQALTGAAIVLTGVVIAVSGRRATGDAAR